MGQGVLVEVWGLEIKTQFSSSSSSSLVPPFELVLKDRRAKKSGQTNSFNHPLVFEMKPALTAGNPEL